MFKFSLYVIKRRHCSVALRRRITHARHRLASSHQQHLKHFSALLRRHFHRHRKTTALRPLQLNVQSVPVARKEKKGKVARCSLNMLSHPNSKVHFNYDIWNLRRVGVRPLFPNSKYATGTDRLNGGFCNGSCASSTVTFPAHVLQTSAP